MTADLFGRDGPEAEQIAVVSVKAAADASVRSGVGVADDDVSDKRADGGRLGRRGAAVDRRQRLDVDHRRMVVLVGHVHL